MAGTWLYGTKPSEYHLRVAPEGRLRYDETHASGKKVSGRLSPRGGWYQGDVADEHGAQIGTVRLRLDEARSQAVSNFRTSGDTAWSKDIVARAAEVAAADGGAARRPSLNF
ncbi:unnamed protein product [Prorocentrum cordatum]|uniref:Uncharacterized protein n=1 Tax=Prorocentrum cordatum TaxID=2364126 RepID=A0ABN9VHH5_9DINO|nr:unnamed protein product [Polarella glacialis]